MEYKEITTKVGKVFLGKDGIIRSLSISPKFEMNGEAAEEIIDAIIKVSNGQKRPIIVEMKDIAKMDIHARKVFSGNEDVSACALMVNSLISKVIGNFFIGLNKATIPVKIFTNEDKALSWSKSFIIKNE